jgi:hypothetical protein
MVTGLVGEEGYQGLASAQLSVPDISTLAKKTFAFYGLSLGEALPPSDSSEGNGTTSLPTGSTTTGSTSEGSGSAQETPGSLASVGS